MVSCWTCLNNNVNNYRFNDSCYAILIVRKQDATGNLLLSINEDDKGDGDYQDN